MNWREDRATVGTCRNECDEIAVERVADARQRDGWSGVDGRGGRAGGGETIRRFETFPL